MSEVAWLAGLLDGEGSVGIRIDHRPHMKERPYYFAAAVQLSMTCEETIRVAKAAFEKIGVTAVRYHYREKDPSKHLDAHYLHVSRLADIERLARAVLPYAVTKRRQWEAMLEYVTSRLRMAGLDEKGRIRRGGHVSGRTYSAREIELAKILKALNARGPSAKRKAKRWLRKVARV